MTSKRLSLLILPAALAVSLGAAPALSTLWHQPYTHELGSFPSVVASCVQPTPLPVAAIDDFELTEAASIREITWWSAPVAPWVNLREEQLGRQYYIAIYAAGPGGAPPTGLPLFETCVLPTWQFWDFDCNFDEVYRQQALLPAPVALQPGRYWLQISEDDSDSVQVGVINFRWAAHRDVTLGRALGTPDFHSFGLLKDPCDQQFDDLAFTLRE